MDKKRPATFTLSVDARLLYERLMKLEVGDEVSYNDLSEVIQRDVRAAARTALKTARRIAKRDHHRVFGTIITKGLRRLNDVEIVGTGDATLRGIRSRARSGAYTVACVADYEAMPNDVRIRHNATLAILGVVEQTVRERNVQRIAGQMAAKGVPSLTAVMERTLSAFKGDRRGGDK